jgi:hypothetical protein
MTSPTSDLNRLHEERRKALPPVDRDLGALGFEVTEAGDDSGFTVVLSENRGQAAWTVPVHNLPNREDAEAVARGLNDIVSEGILTPGPLLPTNDSVSEAPVFGTRENDEGFGEGGVGLKIKMERKSRLLDYGPAVHCFEDKAQATALCESLNRLLESKVMRSKATMDPLMPGADDNRRIASWETMDQNISRMADKAPEVVGILESLTKASVEVDPKTQSSGSGRSETSDPHYLPLVALDDAGIHGQEISGLYQLCGRHPGKMAGASTKPSVVARRMPTILPGWRPQSW